MRGLKQLEDLSLEDTNLWNIFLWQPGRIGLVCSRLDGHLWPNSSASLRLAGVDASARMECFGVGRSVFANVCKDAEYFESGTALSNGCGEAGMLSHCTSEIISYRHVGYCWNDWRSVLLGSAIAMPIYLGVSRASESASRQNVQRVFIFDNLRFPLDSGSMESLHAEHALYVRGLRC